jgi:hypothetical protein
MGKQLDGFLQTGRYTEISVLRLNAMAKVKDQVYDGSEEVYTDASGKIWCFGEFIRNIMPDAYPLPSLNPTEVTRKTSRGAKTSEQGPGSSAQRPWRDCFQQCADCWNELPDVCPEIPPCPELSSRKNVWDAKSAQGVMCSYFDLWMGCCLSTCTELTVYGADGVAYTGGSINCSNGCWPCESPCKDSVLSIGYTTDVMGFGETQLLKAHDSQFGDGVFCCRPEELVWTLVYGKGTLSHQTGPICYYKAPDENPTCEDSPMIKLEDCCGRIANLSIYVTHQDVQHVAFYIDEGECIQECHQGVNACYGSALYRRKYYDCLGVHIPALDENPWFWISQTLSANCGDDTVCNTGPADWCIANPHPFHIEDLRLPDWIADGCCPGDL